MESSDAHRRDPAALAETGSIYQESSEVVDLIVDDNSIVLALEPGVSRPNLYSQLLIREGIRRARRSIVDLGCGSGAVGVFLAKHCASSPLVTFIDLSAAALALAERNAELNGVSQRSSFARADWLDGLSFDESVAYCSPPHTPCPPGRFEEELKLRPAFAVSSFGGPDGTGHIAQLLDHTAACRVSGLVLCVGAYLLPAIESLCVLKGLAASVLRVEESALSELGIGLRGHIEDVTGYRFRRAGNVLVNELALIEIRRV